MRVRPAIMHFDRRSREAKDIQLRETCGLRTGDRVRLHEITDGAPQWMVGEYGTVVRVYYGRITKPTSPRIRVTVRFDSSLKPRTVKPFALTRV